MKRFVVTGLMVAIGLSLCVFIPWSFGETPPADKKADGPAPTAETPALKAEEKAPTPRITVEWTNKPLRAALETIGEIATVSIIADLTITSDDMVTVIFRNLEWKLALEEVARLSGCIMEEVTPVLYRVTKPPRVTMSFKSAPLDEVIRTIAQLANVNIIIADDVRGTITMTIADIPWMEAMKNIVKTTGYALVQEKGNLIRIIKTDALKEQLESRVFQLKYLRPPGTFRATISTPYATGSVKAPGDAIKEFNLLNIIKNMLTTRGSTPIGSLEYDMKSNIIIVKDTKPVLDEIQKVIERLDVQPEQIMIALKFVSTGNDDLMEFGLRWTSGGTAGGFAASSATGPMLSSTSLPFGRGRNQDPSFNQWYLNTYDLAATLRLFKNDKKSRLIQEPTIITTDGQEATVFVGESISFAQTTASSSQSGGVVYSIGEATKSPVKTGFQLWILPYVVKGENKVMINMIPQQELLTGKSGSAAVAGFERYTLDSGTGTQYIDLPRVQQSTIVSYLILENGHSAIVGGLSFDRIGKELNRVPFLGDTPILSNFFSYRSDSHTTEHLLVFVTPHILKSITQGTDIMKKTLMEVEKPVELAK